MGYDSAGDFYPLKFDALLRPKRKADGTYTFTWFQGGAALEAERTGPPAAVASKWTPTEAQLEGLCRQLSADAQPLRCVSSPRVRSSLSQGTNQRSLEFASVERDIFVAESVSAEIDFERDAGGKVVSLDSQAAGTGLAGAATLRRRPELNHCLHRCPSNATDSSTTRCRILQKASAAFSSSPR